MEFLPTLWCKDGRGRRVNDVFMWMTYIGLLLVFAGIIGGLITI